MNFYNLRCFITLAENLNYTRASEMLNVTQPTLSKIVFSLEEEIGSQLFDRNHKSVKLTAVGRQFYSDCLKISKTYNDSLLLCRSLEAGIKGHVKIGFVAMPIRPIMRNISRTCAIYCPEIQLQYIEDRQAALLKYLSEGCIDIALFCEWGTASLKHVITHTLYEDEYCLIVSDQHPLSDREEVDIAELVNETFIVCKSPNSAPDYIFFEKADNSAVIHRLCLQAGFLPKAFASAHTLLGMLMIVANNDGVTIAARHLQASCPGTRFIKIKNECPSFRATMAWRDNSSNASIMPIVNTIKEYVCCIEASHINSSKFERIAFKSIHSGM